MLELYQAEDCDYSQPAREVLSDNGVSYVAHNPKEPGDDGEVRNEQTLDELERLSEAVTTPFLVDHQRGETVEESDAIVDYVEQHYA